MSIKIMNWIWQNSPTTGSKRLVLLAIADNANDEGFCWPSIQTIARKSNLGKRYVQRIINQLKDEGHLIITPRSEDGLHKSNIYKVVTVYRPLPDKGGDEQETATPDGQETDTPDEQETARVAARRPSKPSVNHQLEPSFNGGGGAIGEAARMCEELFGTLSSNSVDTISEWVDNYPKLWIGEALQEAKKNKARSIKYVTKVLENRLNGKQKIDGRASPRRASTRAEIEAALEDYDGN